MDDSKPQMVRDGTFVHELSDNDDDDDELDDGFNGKPNTYTVPVVADEELDGMINIFYITSFLLFIIL